MTPTSLVISENHGGSTLLLAVSGENPANRRPLARIDHAPNRIPRAAIAPGGDKIAYSVLPPGGRSSDLDGLLWLVDLDGRTPRRLATGIDAGTTPVWSPAGTHVAYQRARFDGSGLSLVLEQVEAGGAGVRELARASSPDRLFPVGYAPDETRFLYVWFTRDGAFLCEVDPRTGAMRRIARLADGAARGFVLSPARTEMLYLALSGAPARYHAMSVDLRSGDRRLVLPTLTRDEDAGVAWRPDAPAAAVGMIGVTTVGGERSGQVALTDGSVAAERASGFDVPVQWSADGRLLVVRAFSGATADNPGREDMMIVDREGVRRRLTGDGPVEFIGWVTNAP